MTEVIYYKDIYILLVDDVTLTVYKVMNFNIRSPIPAWIMYRTSLKLLTLKLDALF